MCGSVGKQIPAQNKQVCRDCDSAFWFLKDQDVVVKFCKGCKNFSPLGCFTDKPLASKCGKCRQRGKNTYLAKKGFAPVEDHDDLGTGMGSVYTPGAAAVVSTLDAVVTSSSSSASASSSSSSSATTGMKRSRLASFGDSEKAGGSTSLYKYAPSPRNSALAGPGPGPGPMRQPSAFDMLHLPTDKPTRPPMVPDRSVRSTAAKKPRIQVSFASAGVPAPVTLDPHTSVGCGIGYGTSMRSSSSSSSSGLAPASAAAASAASPSNLQDRWQWDPLSTNNPLNYLVFATSLAPPPAGTAAAAAVEATEAEAAAWGVAGAPTPLAHAAPAPAALDAKPDTDDDDEDAAVPSTDGTKHLVTASAGLMALVELCCDKENTENELVPTDVPAPVTLPADTASLPHPVRTLPMPLPPAALAELETWATKFGVNVRSLYA